MTGHEQTLKSGSQLEEFRIEGVLGEGGFGITYLALDTHFQRHVAIKEYFYAPWCFRSEGNSINSRSNHKEDFKYGLDSFLQEARTIWKFKHPNIVKVIRFFEANGTAYIVMEYIEGQTLGSKIDEFKNESGLGMFNEKEMLFVLDPIINGLKKLHGANVYHRDLKPDNIMLRKKGSPVLIDFGAAREATGNKSQNLSMIVTEGYSPLEQYNSTSLQGPWTDIYALAAVAYTCLTGEKPDDATHRSLNDELIPLVEAARGQGSLNFLKAVDKALAIRPTDRPQTLEEWWEQLEQGEEVKATRGKDVYLKEVTEESLVNSGCQRVISYQGKKFNVKIPAKSKSGTQLKLKGKGEQGKNGGDNGDLFIEVIIEKSAVRGNDIYLNESIKEWEANKGCQRFISYQGKKINVTVPAGTKSGTRLKLAGKGEQGKSGGEDGDLYIEVKVKKPKPKNGTDIYRVKNISAEIAKTGGKIEFAITEGDYDFFLIPKNTSDGDKFTLLGKGKPGKNGGRPGDLLLTVNVEEEVGEVTSEWNNAVDDLFWRLFSFEGRLNREGFWAFTVFFMLVELGPYLYLHSGLQLSWVNSYLNMMGENEIILNYGLPGLLIPWPAFGFLFPGLIIAVSESIGFNDVYLQGTLNHMAVCNILLLWPSIAVQTKRSHDVGLPATLILRHYYLPIFGSLVIFDHNGFQAGKNLSNEYGERPRDLLDEQGIFALSIKRIFDYFILVPIFMVMLGVLLLIISVALFLLLHIASSLYEGKFVAAIVTGILLLWLVSKFGKGDK